MTTDGETYLIRTRAPGDLVMWWRPNRCGYTVNIDEAGHYTKEEAEAQARARDTDEAWSLEMALTLSMRVLSVEAIGEIPMRQGQPDPDEYDVDAMRAATEAS